MKFLACLLALLLVACTQVPAARISADPTPAPAPAPAPAPTPVSQRPVPASAPSDPAAVSRTCKVDTDCEVKNVGNCCGAHPQCVNKDALVDPQAVKARCAAEHRAGMCNVQAISGCTCSSGQCSNSNIFDTHKSP